MDPKRARQASLLAYLQRHEGRVVGRSQIVAAIEGYAGSEEAARKMLQRDLADLEASCDLKVEYVAHGGSPGYRIRRRPLRLDLSGRDLAVLAFVARSLGDHDRTLLHVEALGASIERAPSGLVAPLEPHPAIEPLLTAIEERREVRFSYAKPGDASASRRRIHPWVLVHRGAWYVIGFDLDRGAERRFKLDRVRGLPVPKDPAGYEIPESIGGIAEPWASGDQPARLAVDASQARSIARRIGGSVSDVLGDGRVVVEAEHGDEAAFAEFLVGYGASLEVLEPASLRAAVIRRFDAILEATAR